jgi:hypothetical protein
MTKGPPDPLDELRDQLLGPVDEWPAEDVLQVVANANIDLDVLKRRIYQAASRQAETFRAQNDEVPAHLGAVLRELRPVDLPTADQSVAEAGARKWIQRLFQPRPAVQRPELAYSFRDRESQITPEDVATLDELARELQNEAKKSGDE